MVLQFHTSGQRSKTGMGAQQGVRTMVAIEFGKEAQAVPPVLDQDGTYQMVVGGAFGVFIFIMMAMTL